MSLAMSMMTSQTLKFVDSPKKKSKYFENERKNSVTLHYELENEKEKFSRGGNLQLRENQELGFKLKQSQQLNEGFCGICKFQNTH